MLQSGLSSLVLRKKRALIAAFTQVDKEGKGYVTKDKWCQVMDNVSTRRVPYVLFVLRCCCVTLLLCHAVTVSCS